MQVKPCGARWSRGLVSWPDSLAARAAITYDQGHCHARAAQENDKTSNTSGGNAMAALTWRSAFIAGAIACLVASPLRAQDRMPPITADKLTDAQKKAAEIFAESRGYAVRGPFV